MMGMRARCGDTSRFLAPMAKKRRFRWSSGLGWAVASSWMATSLRADRDLAENWVTSLFHNQSIVGISGLTPKCNCGRTGDLESLCSLTAIEKSFLPFFLPQYPGHDLGKLGDLHHAAKLVRGLADKGDALCREIFRVQAHALGLFFDEMVNTFDPDALIVGGGALETSPEFQSWFIEEIRAGMPTQREEQADIPIYLMPNGDTAGARGAAIEALKLARRGGLA